MIAASLAGNMDKGDSYMAKEQSSIRERERTGVCEPRRYKVIIHNDDFTTMEFVVTVLKTVFFKTAEEAERMMLNVHLNGQDVVGIYSYDVALSKIKKATRMARAQNFPLRFSCQPE